MLVPLLETERLLIRAFRLEDLDVIHHILDIELGTADFGSEQAKTRGERVHTASPQADCRDDHYWE